MDPLDALPPCATTGIGSLPLRDVEAALDVAFRADVPWLPELPRGPGDFMVPAALRGLPGFEGPGDSLGPVWAPFLERVRRARPAIAKVQLAGPGGVIAWGRGAEGRPLPEPVIEALTGHLAAKAQRMVGALRALGVTPLVFIDEPLPGAQRARLERVLRAVREAGGVTGLHCCAQAPWPEVLTLDLDVLSFDARRSLDALVEARPAWHAFLSRGGRVCLGVIPTEPGARYDVAELCEAVDASLRATTPNFTRVLSRSLISPACGLAMHEPNDVDRIARELTEAQALLRGPGRSPGSR